MNAELQAKRMNVVADGLETFPSHGRGKALFCGNVPAISIEGVERVLRIAFRRGVGDEPLHVNDDIFPTGRFQMLREPRGVSLHLIFVDCRSIAIPAIPPKRGSGGEDGLRVWRLGPSGYLPGQFCPAGRAVVAGMRSNTGPLVHE